VAFLTERERIRLLRSIASPHGTDASACGAVPSGRDEFSSEDDLPDKAVLKIWIR
jgi:hypothetical protein